MALFRDVSKFHIYGVSRNSYNGAMVKQHEDRQALRLRNEIGNILRSEMLSKGLSLRQVENLSGVSKTAVARIVNAESDYNIGTFTEVAHALGLHAWKVFQQAEEKLSTEY